MRNQYYKDKVKAKFLYYSIMYMNILYPGGDFNVIGEIRKPTNKYSAQDIIKKGDGIFIHIFPYGSMKSSFEWISGYLPLRRKHVCGGYKKCYSTTYVQAKRLGV